MALLVDGEQQIGSLGDVVAFVIEHAVAENILYREVVPVSVDATLQTGELADGILEHFGDVVVELFGIGFGVHGRDCLFGRSRKFRQLPLQKPEIGDIGVVLVFQGVGVQADEADVSGRERVIDRPEYLFEDLVARRQTVVVAQQRDIGHPQSVQNVALTLELRLHAEIGHVARMENEIEVVAAVERPHGIFRFVVTALRIGDDGETDDPSPRRRRFDAGDVLRIDPALAPDARVVGVVIDLAGGQKHTDS